MSVQAKAYFAQRPLSGDNMAHIPDLTGQNERERAIQADLAIRKTQAPFMWNAAAWNETPERWVRNVDHRALPTCFI